MAPEIQIFLLAMTPIGELRAAIPMGLISYNLNPATVYFLSVLGNIFVVFLLFTFLGAFSRWTPNRFFSWLFSRTRKNHYDKVNPVRNSKIQKLLSYLKILPKNPEISNGVNKYGPWFLPFFVAIPLPATGGWAASLIAFVFGMSFKKAFPLISLGIFLAGLIVLFLTKAGLSIEKYFGWQVLIGIVLISGFVYFLLRKNRNKF